MHAGPPRRRISMNESSRARATAEEKEPFWRRELNAWQSSGLSQAEYQRTHGLTKNAFTYWKLKLLGSRRTTATFVAVPRKVVRAGAQPGGVGGIRLRVAGGYVVEVAAEFETEALERLLTVLERRAG
jgi:transposase